MEPAQVITCHVGPGARPPWVRTLRAVPPKRPRGAAPRGVPAGGLHFSCEKWRKEHQRGEFLPSGLPTLVWDILQGIPLFLYPGLRPCIRRRERPAPQLGGLGKVGWGTASIEAEKNFSLYKGGATQKSSQKIFSQKKVSKSGYVHGSRKRPSSVLLRLPTQKRERAPASGLIPGGAGRSPAILSPCFLIKKAGPPPGRRAPQWVPLTPPDSPAPRCRRSRSGPRPRPSGIWAGQSPSPPRRGCRWR